MNYLVLIYNDESAMLAASAADGQAMSDAYRVFTESIVASGVMRGGDPLEPTSMTTTVRVRDGERIVTDGPYAETKEQLAGYYLIECADLDAAIEIAGRIPGASTGSIEIRPIRSMM